MTDGGTSQADGRVKLLDRTPVWLLEPRSPLVGAALAILVYWVGESMIHVLVFDPTISLIDQMLSPAAHEAWMRIVVGALIVTLSYVWYLVALERRTRVSSMEAYQRRLRRMTADLAYTDRLERTEYARRLHEEIGQQLSAARMFIASADCSADGDATSNMASRIVERAIVECRDLAEDISPPVLEEFGLISALESMASRASRRSGRSIRVKSASSCPSMDREALLVGYQVLSEVVHSVVAQPETTQLALDCTEQEGLFEVTVRWDGHLEDDYFSANQRISNIGGSTVTGSDGHIACFVARIPVGL